MKIMIPSLLLILLVGMALGGSPPPWLLTLEVALFTLGALAYGFTGSVVRVPSWVLSRPVRGVVFICLGLAAVYIPIQFVISAYFLGAGARLLWATVSEQASLATGTEMTLRPGGEVRRVP